MTIGRRGLKVEGPLSKVDTQMCVLVLHEYLQRMMAVVVGFHFDVIICELVWPRPASAAEYNASGCGNAVGLTSVLHQG